MRLLAVVLSFAIASSTFAQQSPQDLQQDPATVAVSASVPPQKQTITVPAGTKIPVTLTNTISTSSTKAGDAIRVVTAFRLPSKRNSLFLQAYSLKGPSTKFRSENLRIKKSSTCISRGLFLLVVTRSRWKTRPPLPGQWTKKKVQMNRQRFRHKTSPAFCLSSSRPSLLRFRLYHITEFPQSLWA